MNNELRTRLPFVYTTATNKETRRQITLFHRALRQHVQVVFSSAVARYSSRVIGNRSYEICTTVANLQNELVLLRLESH